MFMEQKTQPQEVLPEGKRTTPQIYIYSDSVAQPGWLKIGQTTRDVAVRMREQHNIVRPNQTERLEWQGSAFYADGSGETFTDKAIHRYLRRHGYAMKGEWCRCSLTTARNAYEAVRQCTEIEAERYLSFPMREEQRRAVEKTIAYFAQEDAKPNGRAPHFLWNAKMRFGKTFTTYQLAKRMQAKRVLVLTFKPAVEESWHDDLMQHTDFSGWQFFSSRDGGDPDSLDPERPIVCFGSFQDYLGKNDTGGIKAKNEWVHAINWDLIVLDEYHFGAWNDHAKTLLDIGREDDKQAIREQNELLHESGYDVQAGQLWDEDILPITGRHYLYLSGTPFRALNNGEFLEDQIFNWTYQDEQRAKAECTDTPNPYEELPTMVMMTYQMPADLGVQIEQYDMNEFDLNEFFRANGNGRDARFVHEKSVQKWLDIIRGKASIYTKSDDLKTKSKGNTTKEAKKELTNEEKEYRSKRREVQEKLMKFATRIPIFMYLTDYREEALTDIICKLEPDLFERVTGLTIDDFKLLLSVSVFNDSQINDAILKFRRYEDSSLEYTGINRHKTEQYIGAFNSRVPTQPVISKM